MFKFENHQKNGDKALRTRYLDRLSAVLSSDDEAITERGTVDDPDSAESAVAVAPASEAAEAPAPEVNGQELNETPPASPDCAEAGQGTLFSTGGSARLGQIAEQIAEAVTGTLARAAKDLQAQAETDRAKLAALAESVMRISEQVHQVQTEIATLRPQEDSLDHVETELRSSFAALDERVSPLESASKWTQDRLNELMTAQGEVGRQLQVCVEGMSGLETQILRLSERVEVLEGSLRAKGETAHELVSLCSKLQQTHRLSEERLDSHERALRMLDDEVRRRGGVLERLVGALRSVDQRREPRIHIEKEVKVVVLGEPEVTTAGRVIDASQNGLGLVLEAPLPVGSEVRIEVDGILISGRVTHCCSQGNRFAAGLSSVRQLDAPANGGN